MAFREGRDGKNGPKCQGPSSYQKTAILKVHEQRGSKIVSASTSCFLVVTGIKNSASQQKENGILHTQTIIRLMLSFFPLLISFFSGGIGSARRQPFTKTCISQHQCRSYFFCAICFSYFKIN